MTWQTIPNRCGFGCGRTVFECGETPCQGRIDAIRELHNRMNCKCGRDPWTDVKPWRPND